MAGKGSIEERGENRYRLVYSQGLDADGKQIKKTKTVQCKGTREAEAELNNFIHEIETGQIAAEKKVMKLGAYFDYFMEHYGKDLAPKTQAAYKGLFTRIKDTLGHKRIDRITPNNIRDMIKNLQEPGIYRGRKKDQATLSPEMVKKHFRLLNLLFNKALKWGLVGYNPCGKVDTPKAKQTHISIYDENQLSEFLVALEKVEVKYQALLLLALSTGLRRGEIFGLTWENVSFEKNTIRITQALQYLAKKGLELKDPKTENSKRLLSVPESVMIVLKSHKAEQSAKKLKLGDKWHKEHNFVFTTWEGKPMHPDSLNTWLARFTSENKFPHISPHAFRHMAATFLLRSGVDVRTVSGKLGHAKTSTTVNIYAHLLQSAEQETANIMGNILEQARQKAQKKEQA